tara:strand:- start:43664 stop:46600 length:2937 start_codon:yes stop_codon:yes gene_type:complete
MAKQLIRDYIFTPGGAGAGTIEIPCRYDIEKLLLITNVTDNVIIYNFGDPSFAGTTSAFSKGTNSNFPTVDTLHSGYSTITLAADTSSMSASDKLQIYAEPQVEYGQTVRPWQFGTDAIERMRVSTPESMIDADFEYGLQPTKWAGYGTIKGYPSTYDEPGVDLTVNTITTDYQTTSSSNSLISIAFVDSDHALSVGDVVNVSGLDAGTAGFSRADGSFIIDQVPDTQTIKYFARGIVGTSDGDSLKTEETIGRKGGVYANSSIPVTSAASNGADPSVITLTFTNPHGLIPGTPIHATVASGTNKEEATGPFVVKSTPSLTTLTYVARAGATVASPASVTLYAISNATILHRPSDGGVILSTKTPTYAAAVIRQSKRFFRYQSGKGFLWSSGTLFAPNYDIQSVTAAGTTIGSAITVKTDDIDHGLQIGADVSLSGISTSGYVDDYVVASIVDDYTFTVAAKSTLGDTTAVLAQQSKVYVKGWVGSAVRAGMFDDQNGIFFEYDGNQMFCVKRSSTDNITGTLSMTQNSNAVTGSNTRLTEQVRAGDRIIIRGMTHFVTQVVSNTSMFITPDYRGITQAGIRSQKVSELRVPQSKWNMDKADGLGSSGYHWDFNKMQMIGLEYSWYGAGFIHFMVRGDDGRWLYIHRMKNNNINDEAYMRSGNLPVRYSIENDSPITHLTSTIDASVTSIPAANLQEFDDAGTLLIDNEIISYTGRSVTDGAGNFTGCTRSATLNQYLQGTSNSLTAGSAAGHSSNTGIIEISNTCSPTLSHWGSALVMDGGFDFDRGYIFNYSNSHNTSGDKIGSTPITSFVLRLAPSVSNSSVGRLGAKELLNRSQLLLQQCAVGMSRGSSSSGEVVIQGIINPRNFSDANWKSLNAVDEGGQPSFAQVAEKDDITWSSGSYALPGERIFAFVVNASRADALTTILELGGLKELSGAPLGGDYKYPDGPDVLAINAFTKSGDVKGTVQLRWGEAQA